MWVSPRQERHDAVAMGEKMADQYERYLGRPLMAAELREVHAESRQLSGFCARRARGSA
jgi:hypothetical protein